MRLKNGPPCGPNAIVFTISPTHGPQVGKSVSVMEQSSIDPKTSVLVKVFNDFCNTSTNIFDTARPDLYKTGDIYSRLEVWKLNDVVFLDDSPSILGRVVAIDRQQAVVDCSYTEQALAEESNIAKSSLKVFKLAELEACIEGPDFQTPVTSSSLKTGAAQPSASTNPTFQRTVTRHVSGTVQHLPVCIIDPTPYPPTQRFNSSHGEAIPASSNTLSGLKPLAVHVSDSGPSILFERLSDRATFLACSTHLSTDSLNVSSFVALSQHESNKVKRCTIPEEAVNSIEAGLVVNPLLTQAARMLTSEHGAQKVAPPQFSSKGGNIGRVSGKVVTGKRRLLSRKGKTAVLHPTASGKGKYMYVQPTQDCTGSNANPDSIPRCDFIPISAGHPDLFFIHDISGSVWPLLDGLSLKCTPTGLASQPSGIISKRPSVPQQSYRCIISRQYAVQGQGDVAVLILGKYPPLLSCLRISSCCNACACVHQIAIPCVLHVWFCLSGLGLPFFLPSAYFLS